VKRFFVRVRKYFEVLPGENRKTFPYRVYEMEKYLVM
jgi:hypothetical protein